MLTGRQFATLVLVLLLLFSSACKKKKPQLPKQAQAPTIQAPLPDKISEAAPPPPPSAPPREEPASTPAKPKSQPRHRRKPTQPATTPPATNGASGGNTTVAAAHPPAASTPEPAPDTAIAADISREQATQQKQTTAQLLDAAEKNLKTLPATLSSDQKAMVEQVKAYINQSHLATDDKDLERAYNLAQKARLLSDALVKK